MSAITHFYHLAALDYVDLTGSIVDNGAGGHSPWFPQHLNRDSVGPNTAGQPPGTLTALRNQLVSNYVKALEMRRKAHVFATLVDGKHPCNNAQVPGGMTTKPSRVDWARVISLMNEIRVFIGTVYLPDLLTVALAYGGSPPLLGLNSLFLQGRGVGRTLAFGAFPIPAAGRRLFEDGTVTLTGNAPFGAVAFGETIIGANEAFITEDTYSSHYSSPSGLHPSVGVTTPDKSRGYTWHKAPLYRGLPHEVGPLARMLAATLGPAPKVTVSDSDIPSLPTYPAGLTGSIECATNPGWADHLSMIPAIGPLPTYTAGGLVTAALTAILTALGLVGATPSVLFSILGRHAARGLEAKYIMDAMGCHAIGPGGGNAPGCTAGIPFVNSVVLDPNPGSEVYTYKVMPKKLSMGRGLTEAPRGALGHWITTENRRIVNYQAVVPSTWNACGKSGAGGANRGPIEQTLMGLYTGYSGDGSTPDEMVNRLLRAIHPFDICIACSVHMTDTKGNTIAKFRMDPDGRITKDEVAEVAVEA